MMKIALGTVQFGLDYGIANSRGQVAFEESEKILAYAQKMHVSTLDTAAAYGNSEQVLGRILNKNQYDFRIVTKIPHCSKNQIKSHLIESLEHLHCSKIFGVLFHSYEALRDDFLKWDILKDLKQSGVIQKIGVSIYHPSEWLELKQKGIFPDIVQFPFSIFDTRFVPYMNDMKKYGVEIHVRSVFLQGLYFLDPNKLHDFFTPVKDTLSNLNLYCYEQQLTMAALCLNFAYAFNEIDQIIIGVNSLKQLKENLAMVIQDDESRARIKKHLLQFKLEDERMVLPYLWPKK